MRWGRRRHNSVSGFPKNRSSPQKHVRQNTQKDYDRERDGGSRNAPLAIFAPQEQVPPNVNGDLNKPIHHYPPLTLAT